MMPTFTRHHASMFASLRRTSSTSMPMVTPFMTNEYTSQIPTYLPRQSLHISRVGLIRLKEGHAATPEMDNIDAQKYCRRVDRGHLGKIASSITHAMTLPHCIDATLMASRILQPLRNAMPLSPEPAALQCFAAAHTLRRYVKPPYFQAFAAYFRCFLLRYFTLPPATDVTC